jgi:hypothetical protein
MPSFPRTLVGITPLCDADLTITLTKHDVKAQDQPGTTILEGWGELGGANNWHFPLIDADHNSDEDSLFPPDDKLVSMIVSNITPCPVPLPSPAKKVPNSYWEHIKHKKQPVNTMQMSYHERLTNGLVAPQEQTKRQRKDDDALTAVTNLNTTSPYPCVHPTPPRPNISGRQHIQPPNCQCSCPSPPCLHR